MPPFDAYLDWEKYLRGLNVRSGRKTTSYYSPTLVRLTPKPGQTYADLTDLLRKRHDKADPDERVLIDQAEMETVALLREVELKGTAALNDVRLVLYRPESAGETDPKGQFEEIKRGVPVEVTAPKSAPLPDIEPRKESAPRAVATHPVVGVIDEGVPYLHGALEDRTTGGSLTLGVWLQSFHQLDAGGQPLLPGRIFKPNEIRPRGADERAFYRRVNRELFLPTETKTSDHAASHGAHVMELTARRIEDTLPNQRFALVQLSPASVLDTSAKRLDHNALQGVRWIMARSLLRTTINTGDRAPLVINISFGSAAGPKDGSGFLEEALRHEVVRYEDWAKLLGFGVSPMRVVLAFGNGYRDETVGLYDAAAGTSTSIQWRVQPDDRTASYLEIRAPLAAAAKLTIKPPVGKAKRIGTIGENASSDIDVDGVVVGRVYREGDETSANGPRAKFVIALRPTRFPDQYEIPAPAGLWTVVVEVAADARVTAQAQRDDTPTNYRPNGRQSYLTHPDSRELDGEIRAYAMPATYAPVTRRGTHSEQISAPSRQAGAGPFDAPDGGVYAVGAVYGRPWRDGCPPLTRYSAAGSEDPAWTNTAAPALSAVGEASHGLPGVLGSGVLTGSTSRLGGTSVAAPQVARALLNALVADPAPANANAELDAILEHAGVICSGDVLKSGLAAAVFHDDHLRRGRGVLAESARMDGNADTGFVSRRVR